MATPDAPTERATPTADDVRRALRPIIAGRRSPTDSLLDQIASCPDFVTASATLVAAINSAANAAPGDRLLPPPGWLYPP